MPENIEKKADSIHFVVNSDEVRLVNEIIRNGFMLDRVILKKYLASNSPGSYVNQLQQRLARGEIKGYAIFSSSDDVTVGSYILPKKK